MVMAAVFMRVLLPLVLATRSFHVHRLRRCERSDAIQNRALELNCLVASLLAMTKE
jgi:hypothetical protein